MQEESYHRNIVEFIFDQLDRRQSDEYIIGELEKKYSIDDDTATWAIEMTKTGFFRASISSSTKLYPKSNIDEDPFLVEAIKLGFLKIKATPPKLELTEDELLGNFRSNDPSLRKEAVYELCKRKYPGMTEIIKDGLFDENINVKIASIQAIRDNGCYHTFPYLIRLYQQDNNSYISSNATAVFIKYKVNEAIAVIIDKLSSKDAMLQYDAIRALGELKAKEAKAKVKAFENNDTVPVTYDKEGIIQSFAGSSLGEAARTALKKMKTGFLWW